MEYSNLLNGKVPLLENGDIKINGIVFSHVKFIDSLGTVRKLAALIYCPFDGVSMAAGLHST
jgi:hypothetical protein